VNLQRDGMHAQFFLFSVPHSLVLLQLSFYSSPVQVLPAAAVSLEGSKG
jgi:hypothetical protein